MSGIGPTQPAPSAPDDGRDAERARLRKAAHQLEGIFLGHLFQAMRESVPQSDTDSGAQAMFTSMLDDQLAAKAADQLQRGLGEALYRQLSRRLTSE